MNVKFLNKLLCLTGIVLLVSCASAPPLTDGGAQVRQITKAYSAQCEFVKIVQYNDRIDSMGKNATLMKAIGDTNIRNMVALADGNAFVPQKEDADWFLGNVAYQAEVFRCP